MTSLTIKNFELRNIKYMASLSEETNCYSARLYLDGKPIADVSNHGHGGCDNQHPINGFDLVALEKRMKSEMPKIVSTIEDMDDFEADLELVCGELMNNWLTLRDIKRRFGKMVLFLTADDNAAQGFRTVKITPQWTVAKIAAHLDVKYPGARVLNTMTDDQILAMVK